MNWNPLLRSWDFRSGTNKPSRPLEKNQNRLKEFGRHPRGSPLDPLVDFCHLSFTASKTEGKNRPT